MDTPIAACIIGVCLLAGSLAGGAEKLNNNVYYENFISDPNNYHLVDNAGDPVSQEIK